MAYLSQWGWRVYSALGHLSGSITWNKIDLVDLLKRYGTASPPTRIRAQAHLGYLPGLEPVV